MACPASPAINGSLFCKSDFDVNRTAWMRHYFLSFYLISSITNNDSNFASSFHSSYTGKIDRAINLGSYNYLGFAENNGIVADNVEQTINEYAVGIPSTHHEVGNE